MRSVADGRDLSARYHLTQPLTDLTHARQVVFTCDNQRGDTYAVKDRPRWLTLERFSGWFSPERPSVHVDHEISCCPLNTAFGLFGAIQPVPDLELVDQFEVSGPCGVFGEGILCRFGFRERPIIYGIA